jgi:phosphoglycerol transferase MdoB-like AlkP superfamily enzyme
MAGVAFAMNLFICGVTFGYYGEYHNQFNQWIYGLITDDRAAIARTIWRQYPVVLYSLAFLGSVAAWLWLWPRLSRAFAETRQRRVPRIPVSGQVLALLLIGGVFFLSIRGWAIRRPMKQRDLSATRDAFLNKLVANPYVALRYAILDHQYLTSAKGLSVFLGDDRIQQAARRVFPQGAPWQSLEQLARRTAPGRPGPRPRHVFVIVGESLDSWPMLPEFRELGLADELVRLAGEGISCTPFVSAGDATSHALGTLASGLPEAGVNVNYQPSSQKPYATASAPAFKRLGYHTRFIYSGFPSWQRADEFCLAQGFDEVIGVPHLKNLPPGAVGTWGVMDEHLYTHILKEIPPETDSFNVVLTTVNHPPFEADVYKLGFHLREMPGRFREVYDGTSPMAFYGHSWYTAKCAADFVRQAQARFGPALFVITGDHSSRRFLNLSPTLFQRTAVPFVLAGREVLQHVRRPAAMAGSHTDIVPTLIELCAERGFEYWSLGRNMLAPDPLPAGFGCRAVVTPEVIFLAAKPEPVEPLPGLQKPEPAPPVAALSQRYQDLHALSWWWVIKGPSLVEKP